MINVLVKNKSTWCPVVYACTDAHVDEQAHVPILVAEDDEKKVLHSASVVHLDQEDSASIQRLLQAVLPSRTLSSSNGWDHVRTH